MSVVIMLSISTGAFAANTDTTISKLGQHTLTVGSKKIPINVSLNDGKYFITTNYSLNGKDGPAIIKSIERYADSLMSSNAVSPGELLEWLGSMACLCFRD